MVPELLRRRFIQRLVLASACLLATSAFGQSASPADYAAFALKTPGNPQRGRDLFLNSPKALCATCHTLDGSAAKVGPDLSAAGVKFPRAELVRAVLEPSSSIAIGFGATVIATRSGEEHTGVVRQATDSTTELVVADGTRLRIPAADILSQRTSPLSLMPEGLQAGLTLPEFADLIAFLASLQPAQRDSSDTIAVAARGVRFEALFGDGIRLEHPVWFGEVPGRTNLWVTLEHFGRAWLIERTAEGDHRTELLDLRSTVRPGGATGLLGLAFHPDFARNRRYFLKYQVADGNRILTELAERRFRPDFLGDSGEAPRILLTIPGTTQDHNGGCVTFGPDGFLYLGMGDTGPQRDPQGHGQDPGLLLGKILRIDVDHTDDGLAYAIPSDNPFRGRAGVRPEIWALGFREPWRFSFDSATGELWVGDVGQDRIEEVGIVRAGENHGWNVREGFSDFSNQYRTNGTTYVSPVFAYSHRVGVSVTGGHVYRGKRAPKLSGHYVFADFETRRIWALTQTNRVLVNVVEIGRAPSRAVSFAQDRDGELQLVGYDDGKIYRLDLAAVDPTPLETRVLAATAEREAIQWRSTTTAPADGWFKAGFDDTAWTRSPGGFGTAGTPGAAVRTDWRSADIWLRREFVLGPDAVPADPSSVRLRLHHDEDAEVYLNGVEAVRAPRWTSGYVDLVVSAESIRTLHAGTNVIAIHCHQNSGGQYVDAGLVRYVEPPSR